MRVAYQGVPASYGHLAARSLYPRAKLIAAGDIAAVVRSVMRGSVDLGVVPVTNSIIGAIDGAERAIREGGASIVGELDLAIEHCLMVLPGAAATAIRTVESHPAALAQCARFIVSRGLAARPSLSSASAARSISIDRNYSCAAIASAAAAELYGLTIVERNISDRDNNRTRFVAVARPEADGARS